MPTPASFYRQVDVHLHGDTKFLALTPETPSGRGLFKHLLICPELGPLPGVIRSGAAAMAEVLEWPPDSFLERFEELIREHLVEVDWKARLIFLTNGIRYNAPDNPNQVIGWARHWNALPDSSLKSVIWASYLAHFKSDAERRRKEIQAGTRDQRQDPEALLKAFLENIAKPGAALPEGEMESIPAPAPVPAPAAGPRPVAPPPKTRWDAAPLPGESLLDTLAQELQAAHPPGLAGGTDLQHALLQALKTGEPPRRRHRRTTRNPKPHPVRASRAPYRLVRCLGGWSQPPHEPRQLDQQATVLARAAAGAPPRSHRGPSPERPTQRSG